MSESSPLHGHKLLTRQEGLELAKTYREFARYYFTVRSNVSYLNIIAAGAFTYFFAQKLVDASAGGIISSLTTSYWMFAVGCVAFVAFALWAMSICNLLSNSFFSYLIMVRDLEDSLGVRYPERGWAATFEFLKKSEQDKESGKNITGNVWNVLNAFLVLYGLYALCLISYLASHWDVLLLASVAFLYGYFRLTRFSVDLEAERARPWWRTDQANIWYILVAFLLLNVWFAGGASEFVFEAVARAI